MNRNAFSRAITMMAAVHAAMQAFPIPGIAQQDALNAIGTYQSRGKGKARTHNRGGTKRAQRAAAKVRSVRRHRRAAR